MRQIIDFIRHWIEAVAAAVITAADRVVAPALVRLSEGEDGRFSIQQIERSSPQASQEAHVKFVNGRIEEFTKDVEQLLQRCRAEIILKADRFIFRPLELPARASEFLEGIVRSQIDRLTPWQPANAAFGWTAPVDIGNGKVLVTVAATALDRVIPYIQALTGAGASSVSVATINPDDASGAAIQVLEDRGSDTAYFAQIRHTLAMVLGIAAAAAGFLFLCDTVVARYSDGQQEEITRQITQRRAAIRAATQSTGAAATGYPALERRKQSTPSTVIILEALSKLLPDNTYLVELQLEEDKLRLTGVTREAPSLIRLIEESPYFSRASFFAPTTTLPNEGGERFHIETRARPAFSLP